MTTFSVTGPLLGDEATATWTDGQLEGDFDLCGLARAYVDAGVEVSIPGMWTGVASLDKPHSAYTTLADILENHVVKFTGDDPWLGFQKLERGTPA